MALRTCAFAALLLLAGQKPVDPQDALRRSMERKPSSNVDAVVEQRSPGGGSMRFRMWRDLAGRRRTEVLYPMAMQGRLFMDDGTTWTTYFPDMRVVRVHPSPSSEPDDLDFRMKLIRKNYSLEVDSKTTVAGRPAIRIVARPKRSDDLEVQRFYLDSTTYTPLKIETVDDLGNVVVQFAVRRIDFPARMDKDTFEMPPIEGVRKETGHPPVAITDTEEIERRLGFRPAMVAQPPMGFRKLGVDVLDWHGIMPVAIRLTDGLVRLNVYQFKIGNAPPRPTRPGEEQKVSKDVGDIRIEVRGDGPMAVRERILAEFVKVFEKRAKAQDP